jgi:hypothetical protein
MARRLSLFGKVKEGYREGVSAVVHELRAGGVDFCVHGAGGCIGVSLGWFTLALADGSACFGWARDDRGDFMD